MALTWDDTCLSRLRRRVHSQSLSFLSASSARSLRLCGESVLPLWPEVGVGLDGADEGGDEEDGGVDVVEADRLVRRVHVAAGDRDEAAGDARPGARQRVGVGAGAARVGASVVVLTAIPKFQPDSEPARSASAGSPRWRFGVVRNSLCSSQGGGAVTHDAASSIAAAPSQSSALALFMC